MKNKKDILLSIAKRRTRNNLKRKRIKKNLRRSNHELYLILLAKYDYDLTYQNILNRLLPVNIKYLLFTEDSPFYVEKLPFNPKINERTFLVPRNLSILENPEATYSFLKEIVSALFYQAHARIIIDYRVCESIDLGSQIFLDAIIKDIILFYKKCEPIIPFRTKVEEIKGVNVNNIDVKKLLFSVGSPAIHSRNSIKFPDIIPYNLCCHDLNRDPNSLSQMEQKELDTTALVDYVLECLLRLNKTLTADKINDLSTVIGEILINAEDHSTTKYRYSIGYFQESINNNKHYGVFNLVILNFGQTIYEKFKDPNCPNQDTVERMRNLSSQYSKKGLINRGKFEEETLWSLYALQEGITSIPRDSFHKRGNGSIQFIESFFNLKGSVEYDNISRMVIVSGKTNIIFDGSYNIQERVMSNEKFKVMTFNHSGKIEDRPDPNYVKSINHYFPGTVISAKILLTEELSNEE